jgi:hypothetical protein
MCKEIDAYERHDQVFKIIEMIKDYKSPEYQNINFINKEIEENDLKGKDYDICLMINVHMWMEKQIGKKRTLKFMRKLSNHVNVIYFQTAHAESSGRERVKRLKCERDIFDYLKSCGCSNIRKLPKPESRTRRPRILIKANGKNVLKNARKSFIVNNRDGTITKFYRRYLHLGVMENEIKWLRRLCRWDRSPTILDEGKNVITMEFLGNPVTKENLPPDYKNQIYSIVKELESMNCCSNDIKIENILVLNKKLRLIDYEWSTELGQPIPDEFPEEIKCNYRNGKNFNDMVSAEKLINYLDKL